MASPEQIVCTEPCSATSRTLAAHSRRSALLGSPMSHAVGAEADVRRSTASLSLLIMPGADNKPGYWRTSRSATRVSARVAVARWVGSAARPRHCPRLSPAGHTLWAALTCTDGRPCWIMTRSFRVGVHNDGTDDCHVEPQLATAQVIMVSSSRRRARRGTSMSGSTSICPPKSAAPLTSARTQQYPAFSKSSPGPTRST